jgi:hypothetical protein
MKNMIKAVMALALVAGGSSAFAAVPCGSGGTYVCNSGWHCQNGGCVSNNPERADHRCSVNANCNTGRYCAQSGFCNNK